MPWPREQAPCTPAQVTTRSVVQTRPEEPVYSSRLRCLRVLYYSVSLRHNAVVSTYISPSSKLGKCVGIMYHVSCRHPPFLSVLIRLENKVNEYTDRAEHFNFFTRQATQVHVSLEFSRHKTSVIRARPM